MSAIIRKNDILLMKNKLQKDTSSESEIYDILQNLRKLTMTLELLRDTMVIASEFF